MNVKPGKVLCLLCICLAACVQKQEHVQAAEILYVQAGSPEKEGEGSYEKPFARVEEALEAAEPGTSIYLLAGEYPPFALDAGHSGTEDKPLRLQAAPGERVIIRGGSGIGIYMENVSHLELAGLEVAGGSHGIYYKSSPKQGARPLRNIRIQDCKVYDIEGVHGICVYGDNPHAPIENISIAGCEVFNCRLGDSESLVLNGNIEGFDIVGNKIHHNDNIGIDMIGFEGRALRKKAGENPYAVDFVRKGKCRENVVYGISAYGNPAYEEEGGYDLSAVGIYVDGGQDIEIYRNFVYDCDIGIEVATERKAAENTLFQVSDVRVHDNVIADCSAYAGLSFGGYAKDLGYTRNCSFYDNTFVRNNTQIAVQKSRDNYIGGNLFIGGESWISYHEDCLKKDLRNTFGENVLAMDGGLEDLIYSASFSLSELLPEEMQERQKHVDIRLQELSDLRSVNVGMGSGFLPKEEDLQTYREHMAEKGE